MQSDLISFPPMHDGDKKFSLCSIQMNQKPNKGKASKNILTVTWSIIIKYEENYVTRRMGDKNIYNSMNSQ